MIGHWARANPIWARALLRGLVVLALAALLVVPLQHFAPVLGYSDNMAAVAGVVVAVLGGRRLAAHIALRLGLR